MSEMILSTPVAQGAGESSFIWGLVESVREFLAGAFVSEREPRMLSLIRPTAALIGENLLAAETLTDLEDRLEEAIARPDLLRLNAAIVLDSEFRDLVEKAPSEPSSKAWPENLLGSSVVSQLQKIEPLCLAIIAALHKYAKLRPVEFQSQVEAQANAPLEFLENSLVHPDIKEAILGGMRADHRLVAVIHLLITQRAAPPWLRQALVNNAADEYYQYLRVLASVPQLEVPFELVPASERHDLLQFQLETATSNLWMREFVAGNDDTVFPFADDDDA